MSCKDCTKIIKFQSLIDVFHWDMQCKIFIKFFFFFFNFSMRIFENYIRLHGELNLVWHFVYNVSLWFSCI
ncbi:hypothetical protein C0J52_04168 [Blattella germanica]|nr:hypothetical protein C0J52_04168 [Blattella germanica]